MTLDEFRESLIRHLSEDLDADPEGGPHAQRAKILLDHIGALSHDPAAALDRQILAALGSIEHGLRAARAWASERTRT